jgi:ABC-type transport system involved in cytochrome c biogenesis permease subunit
MVELAISEKVLLAAVLLADIAAAGIGVLQLGKRADQYKRCLIPLIALALTLESVILIFRATAIRAIPLTGLYESLLVLSIVFGLIYLFFTIPIKQVWFGSAMSWVLLAIFLPALAVAGPPFHAKAAAATPWAIAHGLAMILSGAALLLASASGLLYLLSDRRLKQKQAIKVLGRMPNIERLGQINMFGLKTCFVLMTLGIASGIGMAITKSVELETRFAAWLSDPKIMMIISVWVLLALILVLCQTGALRTKNRMYVSLFLLALFLFAVAGTARFYKTEHDFNKDAKPSIHVKNNSGK